MAQQLANSTRREFAHFAKRSAARARPIPFSRGIRSAPEVNSSRFKSPKKVLTAQYFADRPQNARGIGVVPGAYKELPEFKGSTKAIAPELSDLARPKFKALQRRLPQN